MAHFGQPGSSDLQSGPDDPHPAPADKVDEAWPISVEMSPPSTGKMLPLHVGRKYWIRGWRVDIAGNNNRDSLSAEAISSLDALKPSECANLLHEGYRRAIAPQAPMMAQSGTTFNEKRFALIAYGNAQDKDNVQSYGWC